MTNSVTRHWRCPACGGLLAENVCADCQQLFPQTLGIPDLRWPRPDAPNEAEAKLVELILANYEKLSFLELTSLWFQTAAEQVELPEAIRNSMEAYHHSLQARGRQMVSMFRQQTETYFALPGQKLALDIGCGVGASSLALAQQFDEVVGIDPYLPSLLIARKFLEEHGIGNIALAQAYAQHLPLAANSVDYAVGQNVIEHLFTVEMAFREIARVLRPGGCFCGDSRNRFDLFLPEPHAQLRWVGLWPRRWQPWYVWRWRRMVYKGAYLLSLSQLRRYAQRAFGPTTKVVFPLSAAYGRSARWDKVLAMIGRIPLLSTLLLSIFPSHLLVAQVTKQP
jgi:SAM-dependent methyltransferase